MVNLICSLFIYFRRNVSLADVGIDAAKKQQGVIKELEQATVPAADQSHRHVVDRDVHFLDPRLNRVHRTQGIANT